MDTAPLPLSDLPDLLVNSELPNSVALIVVIGFVAALLIIAAAKAFPHFHRFLHYGKLVKLDESKLDSPLPPTVNYLASVSVPKAWFSHFYILFTVLQWGIFARWPTWVLSNSKYLYVWVMLTLQATRRLYESVYVTKWGNSSRMNVSHYILGVCFYCGVSMACWSGLSRNSPVFQFKMLDFVIWTVFVIVSIEQYRNHRHLALLVKYSVPSRGLFSVVSCAHYFDEIVVYFVVALEAWTHETVTATDYAFWAISAFVFVGLSVAAVETRTYYKTKFDKYTVKYAVVPYLV